MSSISASSSPTTPPAPSARPTNATSPAARPAWLSAIIKVVPWLITAVALYVVFHDVEWSKFFSHLGQARVVPLVYAFLLTICSYLMRSRRWQYLFPSVLPSAQSPEQTRSRPTYIDAVKVLILGFFMNNVLPARAGEIVRAHAGGKAAGVSRTLVLATIASERLADGLMLSLMFIAFALHATSASFSNNLLLVALLFTLVAVGVIVTLIFRVKLMTLARKISAKSDHRALQYTLDRVQIFITGLAPLFTARRIPILVLWTIAIWLIELSVFVSVSVAFNAGLTFSQCVLFLVTVNFSSLIPAAPGGVGTIEAITTTVLVSLGLPKELALTMVLVQHVIQILVVGIPGALITLTWKGQLRDKTDEQ